MKDFLRENLMWILIPFLIAIVALGVLAWVASRSGGSTEFVYGL